MKRKLGLQDIKILNEGQQVKVLIESRYGTLKKFHELEKPTLSLKAIMNYCSYPHIRSDSFKLLLTEKLSMGWDEIALSDVSQIRRFVKIIYENIVLYNEIQDLEIFEKIINLCNEFSLTNELALMHRNYAKNHYYRNDNVKAIELYKHAINLADSKDYSMQVILCSELADHYFIERNTYESDKYIKKAKEYTTEFKVNDEAMYIFHYRYGTILNSLGYYTRAREYFKRSLDHATINNESISQKGAALMAIGSTYKREKMYDIAKDYYFKSLITFNDKDISGRSSALNNIADIYCLMKDYNSAIRQIKEALEIVSQEGITSRHLTFMQTYAEIKLLIGDTSACFEYINMLRETVGKAIDKKLIKTRIESIIQAINDAGVLKELEKAVYYMKSCTSNISYIDDLYSCLGRISEKIKILNLEG